MASFGAVSCTTGVASDGTSTPEMTTVDETSASGRRCCTFGSR